MLIKVFLENMEAMHREAERQVCCAFVSQGASLIRTS